MNKTLGNILFVFSLVVPGITEIRARQSLAQHYRVM